MKKILFIMYNLAGGGAEKVLIDLLDNIDYTRYEVDLLLIRKEGVYIDSVNANVKIKSIVDPGRNNIYSYAKSLLYSYLPKLLIGGIIGKKYDIEIAFLEGESSKIATYSKNKKSKKISWIHTDLKNYTVMSRKEEKQIYKFMDDIICVSNLCKQSFINIYPEYNDKTKVIYNLIDNKTIMEKSEEDNKMKKKYILAIGRLVNQKKFDNLIKSYKLLVDEGFSEELVILGEGELRDSLQKLIDELGLEERVHLNGFKSNPYKYIKRCSVFVVSSEYEGFSLVVAEAMILGKAIVTTDCVGPSELCDYGNYGIVVTKKDEYSIKDAIKEVLSNQSLRKYYENKSLERSKIFNKDKFMSEFYQLIE